ncbi:hypothetical protein T4D_2207 [Trichinella pseudospiralis]|uniref:Uncharacterized protein n=1 Tax=Trichinella pseudospiralis TaxID=6337 RepID=A0A0V1FYP0_TRIPS|nr:hypothetical protein T4D_2207 [Trichinella pseudospiralis]
MACREISIILKNLDIFFIGVRTALEQHLLLTRGLLCTDKTFLVIYKGLLMLGENSAAKGSKLYIVFLFDSLDPLCS